MPKSTSIMIDVAHQKTHEGVSFAYTSLFQAVPGEGTRTVLIEPSTKSCHVIIEIETAAKAYWRTYNSTTTFTDKGTPNRGFNRVVGRELSTTIIYENPTVDVLGDLRGNRLIPGGTGGNASGGVGGSRLESIIPPGKFIYLEVENADSQARDISVTLDWYEVVV